MKKLWRSLIEKVINKIDSKDKIRAMRAMDKTEKYIELGGWMKISVKNIPKLIRHKLTIIF